MTSDENQAAATPAKSDERGIVYILTNPAMPDYIKIGMTGGTKPADVVRRMKELNSTNVPHPFECTYAAVVDNYKSVEKKMHLIFGDRRVRGNREFFKNVDVVRAGAALELAALDDVTPDPENQENRPRRKAFNFKAAQVPEGSTLVWARDESITCTVMDDTHVEFRGQRTSLSAAAQQLLGWRYWPQGPAYWMFEDETLNERRRRLEEEAD